MHRWVSLDMVISTNLGIRQGKADIGLAVVTYMQRSANINTPSPTTLYAA